MITYSEYSANANDLHEGFYGQFVSEEIKRLVKSRIGIKNILSSTDKNLNDIPLAKWDEISKLVQNCAIDELKKAGFKGTSLSTGVCIAKAAARQLIKEEA